MFRFLTGFVSQTYSFLTTKIAFVVLATSTILATSGDYSGYYFMIIHCIILRFFYRKQSLKENYVIQNLSNRIKKIMRKYHNLFLSLLFLF